MFETTRMTTNIFINKINTATYLFCLYMLEVHNCLILKHQHVSKPRYSTQARKHKSLLRCLESLKRNDIKTFCL